MLGNENPTSQLQIRVYNSKRKRINISQPTRDLLVSDSDDGPNERHPETRGKDPSPLIRAFHTILINVYKRIRKVSRT